MANIIDVEGIGATYAAKLKSVGIETTEALLQMAATPQGRKELAQKTDIADGLILKWVNHADLFRIKGVAGQYAELLEAAGVDTVVELAQRNPENLYPKMAEVNAATPKVRQVPSLEQVKSWVMEAKTLPRQVKY